MKLLSRIFLTGLITVLPIALTLYFFWWLGTSAETLLGSLLRLVLPEDLYWPGMGLVVGVLMVCLIGVLMRAWVVQTLFGWAENFLHRVPLFKTVYSAIQDFMAFFSPDKGKEFQQVVAVRVADSDAECIGFITRAEVHGLVRPGDDRVAVYLPLSYQIGGYLMLVPRDAIRPLDMEMKDAMRLVLTAGVSTSSGDNQ